MQGKNLKTIGSPKTKGQAIRLPILIPLFVSILILLIVFTLAIYRLQQKHINDEVQARLNSVSRYFNEIFASDARFIGETTHFVKDNNEIQNAWLAKDRDTLLALTAPIYEKLRHDCRVTHLYFIDVNQTCFLRVHNPSLFGDRIERFTLKSASAAQKQSWGLELGPYGTLALRVVQPWFINNTLAGFVEFGEEIGYIAPQLKSVLDVDLAFLIDKSFLNRNDWQEGLKIMGHKNNWNLLPNYVIADSTVLELPPEFIKLAGLPRKEHQNCILTAKLDSSTFSAGFVKLSDASGREVGDILVIKNISKETASLHALLAVIAALSFLIASGLVSFFYIHITGIERNIIEAHSALAAEIDKRKNAETELLANRDNLEETVCKRTFELQEINARLQGEITQRAKAEKSLAKLNNDLEFTIAQLSQTNNQLSEFAHLAAHDLKTPLRGVAILAQWLYSDYYDKLDDQGRYQIDLLVKRVKRMDNFINAILLFSTTARNKAEERSVDLNILLKEVIDKIKPPKNIKITINETLPVIICEEEHIREVFLNLISNAVKFCDKPQGIITIDFEDEKYFWKFSVTDNGIGIEPQHFERIFRLFQMLNDRDDAESEGVGLTMTKKIIELYDGRIWLTSKPGLGSTFFFTFPRQTADITPKPAQTAQI